jgi:type II secretory ATPase GspE/PulE/Tfp pilus assembly ATPase PilB-like protein
VQVSRKTGLDFATAMRAFLRSDPDVIMVGEMRDPETAAIAIEASLTGHLVLSTLHTNSAPETVTRLLEIGMDPFSFSDALLGVLAQRLARALCRCAQPAAASKAELAAMAAAYGEEAFAALLAGGKVSMRRAKGCVECRHTGYKGRVPLHELLVAGTEVKRLILDKAPASAIKEAAVAGGMTTLLRDGIVKVLSGLTDYAQVTAVASS